jgi:hypothetical protein
MVEVGGMVGVGLLIMVQFGALRLLLFGIMDGLLLVQPLSVVLPVQLSQMVDGYSNNPK